MFKKNTSKLTSKYHFYLFVPLNILCLDKARKRWEFTRVWADFSGRNKVERMPSSALKHRMATASHVASLLPTHRISSARKMVVELDLSESAKQCKFLSRGLCETCLLAPSGRQREFGTLEHYPWTTRVLISVLFSFSRDLYALS